MRNDYKHLLVERAEGVVTITMNRPEVLNSFNDLMLDELNEVTQEVAQDQTVRCVVLTGAGRAFGAGQDLSSFGAANVNGGPPKVSEHLKNYHKLVYTLHGMPKPVIAAVRGVAAGISCNVALACDLRIAADNARFIEAFARIGLVPDGGGGYFLPRLVGLGKAMEMALLAEEVNGKEAERIGLVNKCVALEDFDEFVATLAQRLSQGPTTSYGYIKELLYTSLDSDLQSSLALEGILQDKAFATADHQEGVNAFLQKRRAKFTGI